MENVAHDKPADSLLVATVRLQFASQNRLVECQKYSIYFQIARLSHTEVNEDRKVSFQAKRAEDRSVHDMSDVCLSENVALHLAKKVDNFTPPTKITPILMILVDTMQSYVEYVQVCHFAQIMLAYLFPMFSQLENEMLNNDLWINPATKRVHF